MRGDGDVQGGWVGDDDDDWKRVAWLAPCLSPPPPKKKRTVLLAVATHSTVRLLVRLVRVGSGPVLLRVGVLLLLVVDGGDGGLHGCLFLVGVRNWGEGRSWRRPMRLRCFFFMGWGEECASVLVLRDVGRQARDVRHALRQ